MRLHLHPIGRPGEDEKKRASPEYENVSGHADVQRDTSWRTDAAKVAAGSSIGGRALVSEHILTRHDMHRRTYWPSIWAIPGPDRHSKARSSSVNSARGICKSRRIGSFQCKI